MFSAQWDEGEGGGATIENGIMEKNMETTIVGYVLWGYNRIYIYIYILGLKVSRCISSGSQDCRVQLFRWQVHCCMS